MKQIKRVLNVTVIVAITVGMVVAIVLMSGRTSCEKSDVYHSPTVFLMDTTVDVTIHEREREKAEQDAREAIELIEEIESQTSRFRPGSDIYRVNENAGVAPVEVHESTMEMIERSLEFSALSDGAFDVTVAPLSALWGFYDQDYRVPAEGEVEKALSLVSYRDVIVDRANRTVMLARKNMEIDLGAVAKGYAVGAAYELLMERGVTSALVNLGGTVGALGARSDGKPWVIGIRDPRGEAGELSGELELQDAFVSSSGDYERFFTLDGKRYCHIFDPGTGYQPRSLMSVTVVGPDPMNADILSTTIFIGGTEKGFSLVDSLYGYEALTIDVDGHYQMTAGMESEYVKSIEGDSR